MCIFLGVKFAGLKDIQDAEAFEDKEAAVFLEDITDAKVTVTDGNVTNGAKWKCYELGNFMKYVSVTPVDSGFVEKRLNTMNIEQAKKSKIPKKILILTGIKGEESGNNWVEDEGTTKLDSKLNADELFIAISKLARRFANLKIQIINIKEIEYQRFKGLLTSKCDVIVAYAYSRIDIGVRTILKLKPYVLVQTQKEESP